ncbi:hypothetical protein Q4485_10085 [Granulosicoccaceae sp. 1_MG-2023]|nr:hypothetical protein [Granulosicoccaceae sp. 1_MG-2023]
MPQTVDELIRKFNALQAELEDRLDEATRQHREEFQYQLRKGRVYFRREMRDLHRKYRIRSLPYLRGARLRHILSAPLIYSVLLPMLLMDLFVSVYHSVCFRIYGIPRVQRREHIVIDRHKLAYLNNIEKINCMYCGYGNGLISYWREIFARTEQYWCPIKHAQRFKDRHSRHEGFVEYGDAAAYRSRLPDLRKDW